MIDGWVLNTWLFYFSFIQIKYISKIIFPKYETNASSQSKVILVFVRLLLIFNYLFCDNFASNLLKLQLTETKQLYILHIQKAWLLKLNFTKYECNRSTLSKVIHVFARLTLIFCQIPRQKWAFWSYLRPVFFRTKLQRVKRGFISHSIYFFSWHKEKTSLCFDIFIPKKNSKLGRKSNFRNFSIVFFTILEACDFHLWTDEQFLSWFSNSLYPDY